MVQCSFLFINNLSVYSVFTENYIFCNVYYMFVFFNGSLVNLVLR